MPRLTKPVLALCNTLVDKLERSAGYLVHRWRRDPSWGYEIILKSAGVHQGEERVLAERFLLDAEKNGWLKVKRHRYSQVAEKIVLCRSNEIVVYQALYEITQRTPPHERRINLAQLFMEVRDLLFHSKYQLEWSAWCQKNHDQLIALDETKLLCKNHSLEATEELLNDLIQLFHIAENETSFHPREASTLYLADSKKLETRQTTYFKWLSEITQNAITSLDDLGIHEKHRTLTLWGKWTLLIDEQTVELSPFALPLRISYQDISTAKVTFPAIPVITVENKESLHTLALTKPDALLISSGELGGFSNSSVIHFLLSLPKSTKVYHWGDSDPTGFAILASMREKSAKNISSIGMEYSPSETPIELTPFEIKETHRLLGSPFITSEERVCLNTMLKENSKGKFEQEGKTISIPTMNGDS